jgi:hypothetical protein
MARKTMKQTRTVHNVYTVRNAAGTTILRTHDFREACDRRRQGKGNTLVTVVHDVSPTA